MSKLKYKVPISLQLKLDEVLQNKEHLVEVSEPGNSILLLRAKPYPEFYFEITGYDASRGFLFNHRPKSDLENSGSKRNAKLDTLIRHFSSWLEILHQYESKKTFLDDPILDAYAKEFNEMFRKESNDKLPLTLSEQVSANKYLEAISEITQRRGKEINSIFEGELDSIKVEIQELNELLTKIDRKTFRHKFIRILSKARKMSLDLLKDFVKEAKKHLFKNVIKAIEDGVSSLDMLN